MNAKLSDLKPGDAVIADDGFTCMKAGPKTVQSGDNGVLYVPCDEGRHYLFGQASLADNDTLVGLSLPE